MIAISFNEFEKYGCPKCNCESAYSGGISAYGTSSANCRSCGEHFVLLAEGLEKSTIGYGENSIYPELQPHPKPSSNRKWKWIKPDKRPIDGGEFFNSRGVGYPDLAGFIESKQAGERLLEMVKLVLNKKEIKTFLDYRESQPHRIQFKLHQDEFDLEKIEKLIIDNNGVLLINFLFECKKNK